MCFVTFINFIDSLGMTFFTLLSFLSTSSLVVVSVSVDSYPSSSCNSIPFHHNWGCVIWLLSINLFKASLFVYVSFSVISMCITPSFSVSVVYSPSSSSRTVSFTSFKYFLLSSSFHLRNNSLYLGMCQMVIYLLPLQRYLDFSILFSVISLCITPSFSVYIDIYPYSLCNSVSFFSIKSCLLLSACSSFTQSSITTGDVSSDHLSKTISEVSGVNYV